MEKNLYIPFREYVENRYFHEKTLKDVYLKHPSLLFRLAEVMDKYELTPEEDEKLYFDEVKMFVEMFDGYVSDVYSLYFPQPAFEKR